MNPWRKYLIGELSWRRLIKSALSIYLMLMIFAVFAGDHLIFPAPSSSYTSQAENLKFLTLNDTERTQIAFRHLAATDGQPTLLWSHGNGEDIGMIHPLMRRFHRLGYGSLVYDYPGYGLSSGKPSESGCYLAIDRAYQHLTQEANIPAQDIVIVGQSIGSGPSCYLAEKHPNTRSLVLISPFTSIYRVAFGAPVFPNDRFDNLHRIQSIQLDTLIMHGALDEMIPIHHAKQLANAHLGKTHFHEFATRGHNDITGSTDDERMDFIARILQFTH
ncbi:alpha/beta hydrolase [Rubritalea marina]|uniref:alpha/beta hydrolase n=1 Tax=Rubritalea marina TaxID=361055 RepID=UPI000361446C|nr:alpha/beta fold hydrolase [Rubritalea marina]